MASEVTAPKTEDVGQSFMIGLGRVGAVLFDINCSPCLRIDDRRWSLNTSRGNIVLSQNIVDRLVAKKLVAIAAEKLMNRDQLELTKEGLDELTRYALVRAAIIAAEAFERAPDQDWETGSDGEGEETA